MKTKKRLLVGLLALVVLLSLTLTFVACQEEEPPTPPFTAQGEEAIYYCDGESGEETIELKNGVVVLKLAGDNKNGTYVYTKDSKEITITFSETDRIMGRLDVNTGVFTLLYGQKNYELIKKVNYVVSYDVDGGSAVQSTEVINGRGIARPADPSKAGYIFAGWYTDSAKTTAFNFKTDKITANTTLYAKFVQQTDGAGEFTVELIQNGQLYESRITNNGYLYNLPELTETGKTFLGWWISDSREESKLTRQYFDNEKIVENTKLFAVWASDLPAVSVFSNKITWNAVAEGKISYNYVVQNVATGTVLKQSKVENTVVEVDFASAPAGVYEVSVTVNGQTAKAYYSNKALARVSLFEVDGNDLMFNKVDNATDYLVQITCGDPSHVHTFESLNGSATYNFADCQIGENGYQFVVKAVSEGFIESVSDVFVYNRSLGEITNLTHNTNNETVTWDAVEGATSYTVKITVGDAEPEVKTVYSESVFVGDYRGNIKVEVVSVAFGYHSTTGALSYTSTRLPAPTNIRVNGSTISWDAVEGATSYTVSIDGKEYVATTNSMTISEFEAGKEEYKISIRANAQTVADNSLYSEEFTAKYGVMGDTIVYENNVLYWDAVFGSVKYVIIINAGTEDEVTYEVTDGSLSFVVTWPKAGENTISVYSVDKDGKKSETVSTKVTTYEIKFEVGTNNVPIDSMYKALGDEYELPQATANGLTFQGWYDNADYQSAKRYEDIGVMAGDMVVYAGWTNIKYVITLDAGEEGILAEDQKTAMVEYGASYVLPIPTSTDTNKVFAGWYTEPRGTGRAYTDYSGESTTGYPEANDRTLYAAWIELFNFRAYQNPANEEYEFLYVEAGPGISLVTEITIPAIYNGTVTYMEAYENELGETEYRQRQRTGAFEVKRISNNAFKSCTKLVTVRIPSTIELVAWSSQGMYYSTGMGAFASCSAIKTYFVYDVNDPTKEVVNIVTDPTKETLIDEDNRYWSKDGVLFLNDKTSGEVEVTAWPYAKNDAIYTVPYGVTNIPQYTFYAAKFTEVYLPSTIRKLNKYSFYSASSLTSIVFMEPSDGQTASNALELSSGDNAAIYSCSKLVSITFPRRLKTFDGETIKSCSKLAVILIGDDETKVGDNYASISFKNASGEIVGSAVTDRTKTRLVYVPRGYLGTTAYDESGVEVGTAFRVPAGISVIESWAFGGSSSTYANSFTHVYIPGSVTRIEESAFHYCNKMTSLIFEGKVDDPDLTICTYAFYYCSGLTELTLPANLRTIEEYAFASTTKLTTIYVETNRDYVNYANQAFATKVASGMGTFYVTDLYVGPYAPEMNITGVFGNTKLASVKVDENNLFYKADEEGVLFNRSGTKILFYPMGKVGAYVIPKSVTEIGPSIFAERTLLTEVTIHAGVSLIGANAFDGCDGLVKVVFEKTPAGQTPVDLVLEEFAFTDCQYLPAFEVPARTVKIGDQCFRYCYRLADFSFEESASAKELTIGHYAFASMGNNTTQHITDIRLPDRVTEIGNHAFSSCSYLETVYIPASVTKMGFYVERNVTVYGVDAQGNETVSMTPEKREVLANFGVFSSCTRLKSITVDPANKYFKSIDGVLYATEYNAANITGNTNISLDDTTKYYDFIDDRFYDNTDGTVKYLLICPAGNIGVDGMLTIPNSVMALGYYAFYYNGHTSYFDRGVETIQFSKDVIENRRDNELVVNNNAFYYSYKLKSISLPKGVNAISKYMFYYCQALEQVNIPNTVASMDQYSFYSCPLLETINFEDTTPGETPVPLEIKNGTSYAGVIYSCAKLKNLTLPERTVSIGYYSFAVTTINNFYLPSTLEVIGEYAFYNSTSIRSISFPNGLKDPTIASDGTIRGLIIQERAFYTSQTTKNLTNVELPEGVTHIGYYAFYGQKKLTSIHLPSTLVEMGKMYRTTTGTTLGYVFYNCTGLTNVTFAPNCKLDTIYNRTFYACTSLESIEIPAAVKVIDTYAFSGCSALKSITFAKDSEGKNYLETIKTYAFQKTAVESFEFPESESDITLEASLFDGVTTLTTVHLSSSVPSIQNVFKGCQSIQRMTVADDNPNFAQYDAKPGDPELPILTSKPQPGQAYGESIKFVFSTIVGELIIPEGFKNIENAVFQYQDQITKVYIPNSMISIGDYAFSYCSSLEEVVWGDLPLLNRIGLRAFEQTESLKKITIPGNPDFAIGQYAFSNSGIEELTFLGQIKTIENYAFASTINLISLTIPDYDQLTIGNYAFQKSGIQELTFAGNVKSLGTYLFQNCAALTTINGWPSSIKTIPNYMFSGATGLTSFTIPDGVTGIGSYAFGSSSAGGGASFTTVTIPATITSIGTYAFAACDQLSEVIFEENENIKSLPTGLFSRCSSLETIDLSPLTKLNYLGTYTFQYSGLREFTVPKAVKTLNSSSSTTAAAGATYLFQYSYDLEKVILHDEIVTFGNYLFRNCTSLTTIISNEEEHANDETPYVGIELPAKLTRVGTYVFTGCTSITKIEFAENSPIVDLGNYFADGCTSLSEVNFEAAPNLRFLGQYGFRNTGLTSVKLPDKVVQLGNTATNCVVGTVAGTFYGCTKLKTVDLNKCKKIASSAFYGCTSLEQVIGLEEVTMLGNMAFRKCGAIITETKADGTEVEVGRTGLASVKYGKGITGTNYGYGVFAECFNLQSVEVEPGSTVMGYTGTSTTNNYGMFWSCTALTTVKIGNTVTEIPASAFRDCTALTDISFINELTSLSKINAYAFSKTSIKSVDWSKIKVPTLGNYIFAECPYLTDVKFSDDQPVIGGYMFSKCYELEPFKLPAQLKTIATFAFQYCSKFVDVVIPEGVTEIGNSAFRYCENLNSVVLPSSLKKFGTYVFADSGLRTIDFSKVTEWNSGGADMFTRCYNLEKVDFSTCTKLTAIPNYMFDYCSALKEVVVPSTITDIGNYAFRDCVALEKLNLPATLKKIGNYALQNTRVPSLHFGLSLTSVGTGAFRGMSNIQSITVDEGHPNYYLGTYGELIKIVANANDELVLVPNVAGQTVVLSADVTIGQYSLSGLTSPIVLPEGMTEIPAYAFAYYMGETVNIPSTVTKIGQYAFQYSGIEYINIPETVDTIGYYAFSYTSNLKTFTVPSSIKYLGTYSLAYSGVEEIYYNADAVTLVANNYAEQAETTVSYFFRGKTDEATNLKYFKFGDNVKTHPRYLIGYVDNSTFTVEAPADFDYSYLIYYCKGSTITLELPAGLKTVGPNLFYNVLSSTTLEKTSDVKVVLPSTVESIGDYAFVGVNLVKFDWNNAPVETLGNYVFEYSKLPAGTFTFPSTVKSIGRNTFYYATADRIIIPATLENIGVQYSANYPDDIYDLTFGYANVGEVVYEDGITSIGTGTPYSYSYGHFYHAKIGKIYFPSTLERIETGCFAYAEGDQLVIPEGVKFIGYGAFYYATFKALYLPSTIEVFEDSGAATPTCVTFGYWKDTQTIYFRLPENKAMPIIALALSYGTAGTSQCAANLVFNYQEEIPNPEIVTFPVVEEETPVEP